MLEGFRPGVVERLGIGYEAVRAVNPRIVYCGLTGYGQTGPWRDMVGHDVNYLAMAGLLDQMGASPDAPPMIPGTQIADVAGGGMNAALGILLALQARERTRRGPVRRHLDDRRRDGPDGLRGDVLLHGGPEARARPLDAHRHASRGTAPTAAPTAATSRSAPSRRASGR